MTTASQPEKRHRGRSRGNTLVAIAAAAIGMVPVSVLAQSAQPNPASVGQCGNGFRDAMKGIADTRILVTKAFKRGEPLVLTNDPRAAASSNTVEGASKVPPPVASVDLCMVKLIVGPGHPGPADAPSTSAGIGIEILLPAPAAWNERIRAYGNSGWSGTPQASRYVVASDDIHAAAVAKGFVVATSDNGHVGSPVDASFAMNPDGSINTVLWRDYSERSLHEVAEKTKAIARAYYGRPQRYTYWDGFSTGGRQALKLAQRFPKDFDGILAGSPAINYSSFLIGVLYGPVAMQQDLGRQIAPAKLALVSHASIKACGGSALGFLLDPLVCRYDPVNDPALLCTAASGPAGNCLSQAEARVVDKLWYGQTSDGSVPSPAQDNGSGSMLDSRTRLWFGWTRGTELQTTAAGGAPGLGLGTGMTALTLQDPSIADKGFRNATGNGMDRWRDKLDYSGLADVQAKAIAMQEQFSAIATDDPNISAFAAAGGKMVMYHGLADEYIPVQGSINYYQRVMAGMGGAQKVQRFYRLYLIPGFTHSGRSEGKPYVPVPQPASGRDEMFTALQNWVEHGQTPETIKVKSSDGHVTLPLCVYPQRIRYRGTGSATSAASYTCS